MKNKEAYYDALLGSKGQLNEISVGEAIGLSEDETNRIISQLLAEYKIRYIENSLCSYEAVRRRKK